MKTVFVALKQGINSAWHYRKAWGVLYLSALILAGLVAWPLQQYLTAKTGHSMMVDEWLGGIDYTVLNDFMRHYGDGLQLLFGQSLWLVLLYVLLFVFFWGGLLSSFLTYPAPFERGLFWGKSAAFFWRILRLSIYFWLIHLILLALFILFFWLVNAGFSIEKMPSEGPIVRSVYWLAPLYGLSAFFVLIWQDYAKVLLVADDPTWLTSSIRSALRFVIRNWTQTIPLYVLNVLLLLAWYSLYQAIVGPPLSVFLLFLLTQLFVIIRLGLRLVNSASQVALWRTIKP